MPKIPTYEIREELETRPTAEEIPIATAGAEFAGLRQLGETLGRIAQRFKDAQVVNETTRANNIFQTKTSELLLSLQDKDYREIEKTYTDEIEKIKREALKETTLREAQDEFLKEFERSNLRNQIAIKRLAREKQITQGRVDFEDTLNKLKENYYTSATPDETYRSILKLIDKNTGLYITPQQAQRLRERLPKELISGKIEYDIQTNPKVTLENLKQDFYGIKEKYPQLLRQKISTAETALNFIRNQRKDQLIRFRINMMDDNGNPLTLQDLAKMAREDMNNNLIDADFAQTYLNSLKSQKVEEPTSLKSIIKFNELVERNTAMLRKEESWLNMGKVPFEEITKFRADVIDANAKGYITDKQMGDLLSETSKTFYRDPVFQNALNQLAAQSKFYAIPEMQARIKAEMYENLITKVIAGKNPRDAVAEVIREKLSEELTEITKKDEFGFEIGQVIKGYKYIGNNQWQKQ